MSKAGTHYPCERERASVFECSFFTLFHFLFEKEFDSLLLKGGYYEAIQ